MTNKSLPHALFNWKKITKCALLPQSGKWDRQKKKKSNKIKTQFQLRFTKKNWDHDQNVI